MANEGEKFDLVVWGATGFVGKLICEYLLDTYPAGSGVTWAMAARDTGKIDKLKQDLGPAAKQIPVIVADAGDPASLEVLVSSASVVVSTVGPYAKYGTPLVEACAKSGTDYVDLAGETQWIRRMIDAHNDAAIASGARIVPCCGFDSIPSDLGVYYLQSLAKERYGKSLDNVSMRVKAMKGGASGGTLASMVNIFVEASTDKEVARVLRDPYALCPADKRSGPRQKSGNEMEYDENAKAWTAPFVMAAINTRVVQRTNALLSEPYGDPFFYDEAMLTGSGIGGRLSSVAMALGLAAFAGAASIGPLRGLLANYVLPAPGEGPDAEARENGFYDLRFFADTPDGKPLAVKVTGDRDPGYGSTAKIIVESAVCLAKDVPLATLGGGIWTPASAMGGKLIDRLTANAGLTFGELS